MLYVFAVVCPPLAALIVGKRKKALVNLLLTLCVWVPGVIHAFIVINEAKKKHDDLYEYEQNPQKVKSYRLPRVV